LRLCGLSEKAKEYLQKGLISLGHAKILASLDNSDEIADAIVKKNLNVRDTEKYIKYLLTGKEDSSKGRSFENKITNQESREIEEALSEALGMQVEISLWRRGAKVLVHCENIDQLDLIARKLSNSIG